MGKKRKKSSRRKKKSLGLGRLLFIACVIALIVIGVEYFISIPVVLEPTSTRPTRQPTPQPSYEKVEARPNQAPITMASKYDNLALGVPGKADVIVDRVGYSLGYIEEHEQPAWVIYRMTKEEATTKAAKRSDAFVPDPLVRTGSATLADYRGSGYDRGHLAPAADLAFSAETMRDSFYMSNMSPQKPKFNRGIWKELEAEVRRFAISEKDVYVVTGPIFPKQKTITIGTNKVTVPIAYYKVVYDRTAPEKMIGFILPHEGSSKKLQSFAVSVDAVEEATGLDFFSVLPDEKESQLEKSISIPAWPWSDK